MIPYKIITAQLTKKSHKIWDRLTLFYPALQKPMRGFCYSLNQNLKKESEYAIIK